MISTNPKLTVCLALGAAFLGCDARDSAVTPAEPLTVIEESIVDPDPVVDEDPGVEEARLSLLEILGDPDPFGRARRLAVWLPARGPEITPAIQAILDDHQIDVDGESFELMFRSWSMARPAEAAEWAVADAPIIYRQSATLTAMTEWAEADPSAAAAAMEPWMDRYPDIKEILLTGLVRGWYAAGDPSELATYIEGFGMGFARQRALSTYIRAKVQNEGIEAVVVWAEAFPETDEVYKTAVYRQVASAIPLFDLEAGLEWCVRHCDGPYGKGLRGMIARRWVWRGGGALPLEWLAIRPKGYERDLDIRTAFGSWLRLDREAAMAWANEMTATGSPPEWMGPILPAYSRTLAVESPREAIQWANQIEADDQREVALTDIARIWRLVDEEAAEAWLQDSPLPEAARDAARKPKKGPGA